MNELLLFLPSFFPLQKSDQHWKQKKNIENYGSFTSL